MVVVRTAKRPRTLAKAPPPAPSVPEIVTVSEGDTFEDVRSRLHVSAVPETLPGRESELASISAQLYASIHHDSSCCLCKFSNPRGFYVLDFLWWLFAQATKLELSESDWGYSLDTRTLRGSSRIKKDGGMRFQLGMILLAGLRLHEIIFNILVHVWLKRTSFTNSPS